VFFRITEGNESICFSHFEAWYYEGTNPEETKRTAPENYSIETSSQLVPYNVLLYD